jgi:hypothetical protein
MQVSIRLMPSEPHKPGEEGAVNRSTIDEVNRLMADIRCVPGWGGTERIFHQKSTSSRRSLKTCLLHWRMLPLCYSRIRIAIECASVRSMRAALCGHEQEGHASLVQYAAVRKSPQGGSLRGQATLCKCPIDKKGMWAAHPCSPQAESIKSQRFRSYLQSRRGRRHRRDWLSFRLG